MCLHVNRIVNVACNFNCFVEAEGLFKVTGSHIAYAVKVVIF